MADDEPGEADVVVAELTEQAHDQEEPRMIQIFGTEKVRPAKNQDEKTSCKYWPKFMRF